MVAAVNLLILKLTYLLWTLIRRSPRQECFLDCALWGLIDFDQVVNWD